VEDWEAHSDAPWRSRNHWHEWDWPLNCYFSMTIRLGGQPKKAKIKVSFKHSKQGQWSASKVKRFARPQTCITLEELPK
jgi:hypothetical protein